MPPGLVTFVQQMAAARREYRADHEAARPNRFRRQRVGLYGTADAHYASERDYFEIIEYIRDMERNDPLVKPMLDIIVDQLMQGGFQYEPATGDEKLDADLKADWAEWSADRSAFDLAGEVNFVESELLICRSEIRDGDCFVLPHVDGQLQFLESERARTPSRSQRNIIHGVELNRDTRRRVRYWFTKGRVDLWQRIETTSDMVSVDAYDEEGYPNVFHVHDKKRITQTRGVSAFTAAQLRLGMLEDVEFALVMKQQMAAAAVFVEETDKDGYVSRGAEGFGRRETVQGAGGSDYVTEEISPGAYKRLPPGKKLSVLSAQIPSNETLAHIRSIQRLVGLQVGLPVIILLMDASETNFSGWRGAVNVAQSLFRAGQRHRRDAYHRNVATFRTRWLIENGPREMKRGLRNAFDRIGKKLFSHVWRLPSWPYIQPLHDAQARALRLSTLQTSPRREAADDGQDFEDVATETVADNELAIGLAIAAAERLNKAAGKPVVHWRDLLNRDLPSGLSATDSVDTVNDGKKEEKPSQIVKRVERNDKGLVTRIVEERVPGTD